MRFSLLPIVLAALVSLPVSAQTADRILVRLGPSTGPTGARHTQEVRIDTDRLAEAARAGRAVALELPGGTVVTTTPDRIDRRGPGRFTWFGPVAGGGRATLTVENGHVAGHIVTPRGVTVVEPRRGGHVAFEPGSDPEPPVDDEVIAPPSSPAEGRGTADPLFPDEFHIALFYTGAVADSLGEGLPAFLQGTVDVFTDVLANSAVPARARLVVSAPVQYDESGTMSDDLYAFQDPFDGQMDEVHAVRDAHSADFAALLTETGSNAATGCGIAFLMNPLDIGFGDLAFSVTKRSCEFGLVFSHELGHNLGLHHDRYVTGGPAAFPFSYGFVNTDSLDVAAGRPGFRTVLAYERECTDVGGRCYRIPYYSNPDSLWNGQPMGAAGTEDNAQSAREAVPYASAFRTPVLARTVTGTTASGPVWSRPVCPDPSDVSSCDVSDTPTAYHAVGLRPNAPGRYYVRSDADAPGVLLLYAGTFNPTAPLNGLVAYAEPDADAPEARRLLLTATLTDGIPYTLVTTGTSSVSVGAFTNSVFGPTGSSVTVGTDEPADVASAGVVLETPRPNPSSGAVSITVRVDEAQRVDVGVFDVLGRRVALLHDGPPSPGGPHTFRLGAGAVPPGVYVVRARGSDVTATQRVTLLR